MSARGSSIVDDGEPADPARGGEGAPPCAPGDGAEEETDDRPPPSSVETLAGVHDSGIRAAEPPSRRRAELPVQGWDRYEILGALGEGGMGAVYKARDPRLGRHVALKFLRGSDPSLVEHFLREARAQARIDHQHVCKVFEVGEVEGHPFLAMQLIDGRPLGEAMADMSLEQRVRAIRDVAEGLHEAHRLGLIHRDVKPANILVERSSDGGFHPYLVDFGLAREIKGDGQTIFSVEGTPCYMSPEQVEGDLRRLDRRSDVYGLGATLYEALTGVPPFAGLPPLDVIWKVRTEPPRLPRAIDRRVPIDLETIVLRCLEKEPQRRYESARAVGEDLQRYLDGEPIRARRAGWTYRAWLKAKKHKLAVALSVCATLALIAVGAIAVRARIAAAQQAELAREVSVLAQEIGQDVKEAELFMQYVYALPLHDTTRAKGVIRERLADVERRLVASRERLGPLAEGPGHYALGRGFLALGEVEEAVRHLELALAHGYATPEANQAAGRARGLLYSRALDQVRRLPGREAREARQRELSRQHLAPALKYLRESVGAARKPSQETAALLALYEGRLDDAYAAAERAFVEAPWSYEARKIQGDALRSRAALAEERGEYELALVDLRGAIDLYGQAAAIATSDPLVHDAQAEAWIGVMRIERSRGVDLQEAYEQAIQSCDRATTAEPRLAAAYAKKAWAQVYHAVSVLGRGADPRDLLADAVASAEQAIRWGGSDPLPYNSLGASYWLRSLHEAKIGLDTSDSLRRAVENNRRAIAMDPNFGWAHNDIGIALGLMGERAAARGEDPIAQFKESARHLDLASSLNPADETPSANQAWFHAQRASYEMEHGADPTPSIAQAIKYVEAALRLRRDSFYAFNNLGHAYSTLARHHQQIGQDAAEPLARSIEAFQSALRLSPADVEAKRGLGAARVGVARGDLARGEDPEPALRAGRQMLKEALTAAPSDAETHLALGEVELTAARAALAARKSPERALSAAEAALRRAHELNAASARPLATLAELHRDRAAWALGASRSADRDLEEGQHRIARALEINAGMPAYHALRASLLALQARATHDDAARADLLRRARDELSAALAQNRFLEREYRPILADIEARIAGAASKPAPAAR